MANRLSDNERLAASGGSASRRSKYKVLIDGEGETVSNKSIFKFACCDCGLIHNVVIVAPNTRKGVELGFAVQRNKRATGQRRRWMKRPNDGLQQQAGGQTP